jgi:predicted glycosyltransferase
MSATRATPALSYRNVGARCNERAFMNANDGRPTLLFHCQHTRGIGAIVRAFALAEALSGPFRVVFLNGGRLPDGLHVPKGILLIDLPPLPAGTDSIFDERTREHDRRSRLIDEAIRRHRPAVLVVDTFPFGLRGVTTEVVAMVHAVRQHAGRGALVVSSVLDLPSCRDADRARWFADRYFDAVLVHGDPAFAPFESRFRPARTLHVPVHYTGFVTRDRAPDADATTGEHVLVSAGSGVAGHGLFEAVLAARRLLPQAPALRFVAGLAMPSAGWRSLQQAARREEGVEVIRHVPDMVGAIRRARGSVSPCGYNTAVDIAMAGKPAIVVPHRDEDGEQHARASRLQALGLVDCIDDPDDVEGLADALGRLDSFAPPASSFACDGTRRSVQHLRTLYERQRAASEPTRSVA